MLKSVIISFFLFITAIVSFSQHNNSAYPFEGDWLGRLVYRDYGSDKMEGLDVRASVRQTRKDSTLLEWVVSISYPNESSADGAETWTLDLQRGLFNGFPVTAFEQLPSGSWVLEWEEKGPDGNQNRPAIMQMRVRADKLQMTFEKWVRYEGNHKYFLRNEFFFRRK